MWQDCTVNEMLHPAYIACLSSGGWSAACVTLVVKLSVFMSSVTVEIEQCLLKVSYL